MHESESLDLELIVSGISNVQKAKRKKLQLVKNCPQQTAMQIYNFLYLKNSRNYRNSELSNDFYTQKNRFVSSLPESQRL